MHSIKKRYPAEYALRYMPDNVIYAPLDKLIRLSVSEVFLVFAIYNVFMYKSDTNSVICPRNT